MSLLRLVFGAARTAPFARYENPSYRQPGDRERDPEPVDDDEPCPRPGCKGRVKRNNHGGRSCSKCGFNPSAKSR
ncbi:hypothetical protein ACWEGE_20150 [Amycolatopsis sp. NPDC004747]